MPNEIHLILFDPNGREEEFWREVFVEVAADQDAEIVEVEVE